MPFLNATSLASMLESALSTHSSTLGRATHAHIIKTLHAPLPSFLSNHLINMYAKLDLLNSAHLILSFTPTRSVVTWTSLIAGSVQNAHFASALLHYTNMCREGIQPNDFTFPCVFKASASLRLPVTGKQLHALAMKAGQIGDVFVGCGCFDMYCKTGFWEDATQVFDEMPRRNIVMWNACISNAVLGGRPRTTIHKFVEFLGVGGEPNSITFCAFLNACSDTLNLELGRQLHGFVIRYGFGKDVSVMNGLIDFYGKCRDIVSSTMVFDRITRGNDVSWCSMMAVYVQNDEEEKALEIFLQSRKAGIELNDFMVSTILSACAGLSGFELGRSVHALAVKACVEGNVFVGSALVDMYGKCGSVIDAQHVFKEMPQRNSITWNAMISAHAHQGHANMALAMFEEMMSSSSETRPNYVTFVCVLSACSRAGAVQKGMEIFESMTTIFGIEPGEEHYACVVDLLGRAGLVERAYDFIKKMPMQPTISVWGALLGACKMYKKTELGKIAADNLFKLDPNDSGNHVVLSNMFAADGRWEEATLVRKEMKEVGIKKGTGYSWITVKNAIHIFQSKDTSHERNSEIQRMLTELRKEMKEAGYIPDTNFALFDLEEEEKVSEVWYHSEKIALAFGLIAIPPGVPIRITKNLRICGDCHSAIKFISDRSDLRQKLESHMIESKLKLEAAEKEMMMN
uniref:DYW domain-containing protein n=1 Tax=Cannabis sativa TaxID=3483 RepID=A0A803QMV5_CANSA